MRCVNLQGTAVSTYFWKVGYTMLIYIYLLNL
mgnify:CR=1 FL=1